MLETKDILETINMIDNENLDVRTITMGISLLDCIDEDIDKACTKVYDKICRSAKDLVKTGEDIQKEYGIPIIHKRISVTPIGMVAAPCQSKKVVKFAYAIKSHFTKVFTYCHAEVTLCIKSFFMLFKCTASFIVILPHLYYFYNSYL